MQNAATYPGTINIWVNGVQWNPSQPRPDRLHEPVQRHAEGRQLSPLNIGTMAMDGWFPGAIGKVAIYDYLLTQAQITAHFSAMTGGAPTGSCANTCSIPVPTP